MLAVKSSGSNITLRQNRALQNFTDAEAKAMTAEDPDYHRRDLREAIEKKNFPVWRLEMQIMPFKDAENYRFNPFDLTKVWPHTRLSTHHHWTPGAGSQSRELFC